MKSRPVKTTKPTPRPAAPASFSFAVYACCAAAAAVLLLWAYSPVMHAPFVFDDTTQAFALTGGSDSLRDWIGPVRPVLMATYWVNARISREETFSFHAVNLLIHLIAAALVFLIVRRLLQWAGAPVSSISVLAGFAAALFLLHPAQTESVAYIAGRSESLSSMFACAAIAAFLYRKDTAISWTSVAVVVFFTMAAMGSKEQAVVLPVLLLLTDFWWNPGFSLQGARKNWKLYAPLAIGAAAAVAVVFRMILGQGTGGSAGFGIKDFTWYQYLFTQFRAIFVYIANFLLPVNLNLDWEFPISKSLTDHGSVFGLVALLGLTATAWVYRKRFPLASYGFFVFLLLLAPTSSILPIKDPVADRRLYLPMLGLLLIVVDFASRLKWQVKSLVIACGAIAAAAAAATYQRAEIWSDPVALWEDTVRKSPGKARPHFQLAFAYHQRQQPALAVAEFEKTAALMPLEYNLLLDWGLAYDDLHQPEKALEKLRQAAALEPTAHVYTQIGKVYATRAQWKEAMEAFNTAEKVDPNFPGTYAYKCLVHLATNDPAGAIPEANRALAMDPTYAPARDCLLKSQRALRGAR